MPGAIIAFNQVQASTPTFGSPGVARNDLWLEGGTTSVITAFCTTSGNISFAWQLLDKPPGSAASLTTPDAISTTWSPDLPGSYRLQLITNGGGPGNIQVLVAAVRFTDVGALVNRGWRLPALGEILGEQNFSGQTRGWDEAWETIFYDILSVLGGSPLTVTNSTPGTLSIASGKLVALCDSTTGTTIVDMPNPSRPGLVATVTDDGELSATNNITVNGNGKNIQDPTTLTYGASATIANNGESIDWLDTGVHWKIK
jgi:hypothetical protein